jgi:rhodanese-related sulfurtransferase
VETIDTEEVRKLVAEGAQLVEVLPKDAYDREHLPGAVSLPLTEMTPEAVAILDRDRPVVTYCYDHECDLSSRAARWLEVLGFRDVYDYATSKVAWLGCGLPFEGTDGPPSRALARSERVPVHHPDDTLADVGATLDVWPIAVVVSGDVVIGVVAPQALALPATTALRDALQPGPPTVRPSIPIDELAESMDRDGQLWVLVTRSDGTFSGLVRREDLEGDA